MSHEALGDEDQAVALPYSVESKQHEFVEDEVVGPTVPIAGPMAQSEHSGSAPSEVDRTLVDDCNLLVGRQRPLEELVNLLY